MVLCFPLLQFPRGPAILAFLTGAHSTDASEFVGRTFDMSADASRIAVGDGAAPSSVTVYDVSSGHAVFQTSAFECCRTPLFSGTWSSLASVGRGSSGVLSPTFHSGAGGGPGLNPGVDNSPKQPKTTKGTNQ